MNRGDALIERGAERLRQLADQFAAEGGPKAKLAEPLAEDAAFLRKLKPSLIMARARGELSTDNEPEAVTLAPSGPQLGARKSGGTSGPNPFVVAGIAFAAGILLAKVIDWRSHSHPRD